MSNYTPMIQQYLKIKAQNQDSFLFFRLGDFYEMFFDDALLASRELEITLTSRDGGGDDRIPMCGVPYHSATNYIRTLVEKGYKVAICEQVEDPKSSKGVVKREVTQLVTPGTVMENTMLNENENNYLASLTACDDHTFSLAYVDLSTGELILTLITSGWDRVISELYNQPIKEIVIAKDLDDQYKTKLQEQIISTLSYCEETEVTESVQHLVESNEDPRLLKSFGRLIHYIETTQQRVLDHLKPVQVVELNDYLGLDMYSKRNLELTETIMKKGKQGSLLWVIDQTVTAMGSRTLKKWIERPLLDRYLLRQRYEIVEGFMDEFLIREDLREQLKTVYDLERLAGRVAYGNVNARDLLQLKRSLAQIPFIKETVQSMESEAIKALAKHVNPLPDLYQLLDESISEDAPLTIKDGGMIKDGFNEDLDQYRDASRNGKQWIAELEQKEKQETGIKSLKIGYNRVFGYYIEVTRANLHLLEEGRYERKQTLTNAERFITPELKETERLILSAEDKSVQLEYDLFLQLRDQVKTFIKPLQMLAEQISHIDCLQSFATVSEKQNYVKPELTNDNDVSIKEGRHPVVEKVMKDQMYVPNDVSMAQDSQMLLITGPNMSGKSTYMRQVALTVILAQVGCFVPAQAARLPIFDQIFTRIGAADDLVAGQSTFMVEMLESKHAITQATDQSLILLDEIGRGTSTYDGMALAQAIIEHIHDQIGAKTLFSTHYHELTTLTDALPQLKNIHVRAEEYEGRVVFLHQIQEGAADESYGIHVAQLAGLPDPLIKRARTILNDLESKPIHTEEKTKTKSNENQLSFFEEAPKDSQSQKKQTSSIESKLMSYDLLEMNPLEAMNVLYNLQKECKKGE